MLTADHFLTSWQPFLAAVLGALVFVLLLRVWHSPVLFGKQIAQAMPPTMQLMATSRLILASNFWGAVTLLYFLQLWLLYSHKATLLDGLWAAMLVSAGFNFLPFVMSLMATFTFPSFAKYQLLEGGGKVFAFGVCGGLMGWWL
ncbi:MAG: hypothetical protein ACXW1C_01640 [Gallionella sp.]